MSLSGLNLRVGSEKWETSILTMTSVNRGNGIHAVKPRRPIAFRGGVVILIIARGLQHRGSTIAFPNLSELEVFQGGYSQIILSSHKRAIQPGLSNIRLATNPVLTTSPPSYLMVALPDRLPLECLRSFLYRLDPAGARGNHEPTRD